MEKFVGIVKEQGLSKDRMNELFGESIVETLIADIVKVSNSSDPTKQTYPLHHFKEKHAMALKQAYEQRLVAYDTRKNKLWLMETGWEFYKFCTEELPIMTKKALDNEI